MSACLMYMIGTIFSKIAPFILYNAELGSDKEQWPDLFVGKNSVLIVLNE